MDTFAPHARLFPTLQTTTASGAQQQIRTLTDHISRSKAQHVQPEFQYARFYYELTQILDTAVSMEREAAIHWQALTEQHKQMQSVLDRQRTHSQEVYQLLETVQQREEAVQQAWAAFQAALTAYVEANTLYARVAMLNIANVHTDFAPPLSASSQILTVIRKSRAAHAARIQCRGDALYQYVASLRVTIMSLNPSDLDTVIPDIDWFLHYYQNIETGNALWFLRALVQKLLSSAVEPHKVLPLHSYLDSIGFGDTPSDIPLS